LVALLTAFAVGLAGPVAFPDDVADVDLAGETDQLDQTTLYSWEATEHRVFQYDAEGRLALAGLADDFGVLCTAKTRGKKGCPSLVDLTAKPLSTGEDSPDARNTMTRVYDALGRVTVETNMTHSTSWTHDGLDPVYSVTKNDPDEFWRDAWGQLIGQDTDAACDGDWYVTDALGSIYGALKHKTSTIYDKTSYNDWGVRQDTKLSTSTGLIFAYSGERHDPTGNALINYHARAYQPQTATWLQADHYRGVDTWPATQARYQFVLDNPIGYVDEYGFKPCPPDPDVYSTPLGVTNAIHCMVQNEAAAEVGGQTEVPIQGGSSQGNGNIGYADVATDTEVWEVKRANENSLEAAMTQLNRYAAKSDPPRVPGRNLNGGTFQYGRYTVTWWSAPPPTNGRKTGDTGVIWYRETPSAYSPPSQIPVPQSVPTTSSRRSDDNNKPRGIDAGDLGKVVGTMVGVIVTVGVTYLALKVTRCLVGYLAGPVVGSAVCLTPP
jgi:RHS repeat-associated protein